MTRISVFAPASIGNFIVGFDCLGAAIQPIDGTQLGDVVSVEAWDENEVVTEGPFAKSLPIRAEDNIVFACRQRFNELLLQRDCSPSTNRIVLHKKLPIGSGLGSSATSVVAALMALNEWYGTPFAEFELLRICGELEGRISGGLHYDNVAPSLRGGVQLMVPNKERISMALPTPDWFIVMCYPGIKVETKAARAVLPTQYALRNCVSFAERLSAFVAAMMAREFDFALSLMRDDMIEPHRASLVPGFECAKLNALEAGAKAFGLSGSGPSCLAICRDLKTAQAVQTAIQQAFPPQPDLFATICTIAKRGAFVF